MVSSMTSLSDDLRVLAAIAGDENLLAAATTEGSPPSVDLAKINWQRLICFAIPVFNMFSPIYGLPPLPVPAFCTAPVPPTPGPVG